MINRTPSRSQSQSTLNESSNETTQETNIEDIVVIDSDINLKNTCSISLSNEDGTSQTIPIGEPWYQSNDNPMQCLAPLKQKCCEQIDLQDGEEGCMVDFTGMSFQNISDWKNECLAQFQEKTTIDIEKLGIVSDVFSGDWIVEEENGNVVDQENIFHIEFTDKTIQVKKNNTIHGIYDLKRLTINPNAFVQGDSMSASGTNTTFIMETVIQNGEEQFVIKIIQTPQNGEEDQLTTFTLNKI